MNYFQDISHMRNIIKIITVTSFIRKYVSILSEI